MITVLVILGLIFVMLVFGAIAGLLSIVIEWGGPILMLLLIIYIIKKIKSSFKSDDKE